MDEYNMVEIMDKNEKLLIQLRERIKSWKQFETLIKEVLQAETNLHDLDETVYAKIAGLENELESLKGDMDLADDRWNEDEN